MFDAASWGVLVAAAGVVIGAGTFTVTRVLEWRASVADRRGKGVARVIAVAEASVRNLRNPWRSSKSSLEFALLLPHLVAELPKEDEDVAIWVARRVQEVSMTTSDRAAANIAIDTSVKLAAWRSGRTKTAWFREQNKLNPLLKGFAVPKKVRIRRYISQGQSQFLPAFGGAAILASAVYVVRNAWFPSGGGK